MKLESKINKILYIMLFLIPILVYLYSIFGSYIMYKINGLQQDTIYLKSSQLKDFALKDNDTIVSLSNDPWLELKNINKKVESIRLNIEYDSNVTNTQVFYTNDIAKEYCEQNSKLITINKVKNNSYLINTGFNGKINSLRFDLTDRGNQSIRVNSIVLNPTPMPKFSRKGLLMVIIFYILILIALYSNKKYKCFRFENMVNCRYKIALCVFIILVLGKFHGSSIGMWDNYIKDKINTNENNVIYGKPRAIRSDEWLVQTTWYLSQGMNKKFYPIRNGNIRSDGQNMLLASYSPVFHIATLGKPFNWGFILLGNDYGLSWYWCSKLILLFLLSFEMSMLLTNGDKKISVLGAVWILGSPAIQWWFSTQVVDLIIYSQALIISVKYYLEGIDKKKSKIFSIIIFTISAIGYILSLYPPIQVALGYLTLIFIAYLIWINWKKIKLNSYDYLMFFISIFIIGTAVFSFILESKNDIALMLNTVYPGKRFITGGNFKINYLMLYLVNWLLPYKDVNFSNACSISTFISFLPVVFFVFLVFIKYEEENKKLIIAIFAYLIFSLCWMLIRFPDIIAKITLFSYVPETRMSIIFGLTSLYLSISFFAFLTKYKPINKMLSLIISIGINIIYFYSIKNSEMISYLGKNKLIIMTLIIFLVLNYIYISGNKKLFIMLMTVFILVNSITVNPLSRGISSIYNKKLSKEIREINEKDPNGKWIALDSVVNGNFIIAQGAKSFNSVHDYPDMKQWSVLDQDKKYVRIYNRYAHVVVKLTNDKTYFKLNQEDLFTIYLNPKDLNKLDVKYILTSEKLDGKAFEKIYFNEIDNLYIYAYKQNF